MKIQIALASGPREIDAQGRGEWAIHPDPFGDDGAWTVTHVPSGLAVGQIALTRSQAGDLAARLSAELPTLNLPARIWTTQPEVKDMGPDYPKLVARIRALRDEVLGA